MISKLPRWIWVGAWVLAFVAGFINVIGLLGFQHQAITHLTGTTSLLAETLASRQGAMASRFIMTIGSFLGGTIAGGFIIQDSTLRLGRRYGVALSLECVLICLSIPLLNRGYASGNNLLSFACGLQNAMVSTYSGAVVRTTHLSGIFTDLGIYLGHALRGLPVDPRRLLLYLDILSAFLCGGIVGTLTYRQFVYAALYVPSALIAIISVAHYLYRYLTKSAVLPRT